MEEDAVRTEPGSLTGSSPALRQDLPPPADSGPEVFAPEVFTPSFSPSSAPASPTPTGTLSRLGLKLAPGPSSPGAAAPGSPADRGQVSAITVVALLDQLVSMLESVGENQQRMERRQAELEGSVRLVQGDVTRLSKAHVCTSSNVGKLLERSRKISGSLKEVRERLDKQGGQVKRLENNHAHLLKRNHFKVLIFQEDNEVPTTVSVKDSLKTPSLSQYDAESTRPLPSIAGSTYDDDLDSTNDDISVVTHNEGEEFEPVGGSRSFERRADRFKRSSLKKVDSLKKAFSRQSIEKKVTQITTKIVPPEKRDKIKKSLAPNHSKSPTPKSSSFKVASMAFNVKKVREGEAPPQVEGAHVEIPPLGSIDGESLAEVHTDGVEEEVQEEVQEVLSPSTPESLQAEGEGKKVAPKIECEMNGDSLAGLAVPEHDEDLEEEEEEEEEDQGKKSADVQVTPTTVSGEQVS